MIKQVIINMYVKDEEGHFQNRTLKYDYDPAPEQLARNLKKALRELGIDLPISIKEVEECVLLSSMPTPSPTPRR